MTDHDGQLVGKRSILHTTLCRDYLCGECGSRLVTRWHDTDPHWRTVCFKNQSHQAIVHAGAYERQQAEKKLVFDALPDGFKAIMRGELG